MCETAEIRVPRVVGDTFISRIKLTQVRLEQEKMQKLKDSKVMFKEGGKSWHKYTCSLKTTPTNGFPPCSTSPALFFRVLLVPHCLPSGSRVASSFVAVRGGRATLTVSRDSRTAASSQAHEAIPLVGASAPHTSLLHLPLDTDPIWGSPPNHQLLPGRPVTHWNSPNHLGWEVTEREKMKKGRWWWGDNWRCRKECGQKGRKMTKTYFSVNSLL